MGSGSASHACTTRYFPGGWIGPAAAVQRSTRSGLAFRNSAAPPRTSFRPVETKYLMSSGTGIYPTVQPAETAALGCTGTDIDCRIFVSCGHPVEGTAKHRFTPAIGVTPAGRTSVRTRPAGVSKAGMQTQVSTQSFGNPHLS